MIFTPEILEQLDILIQKEVLLAKIVTWLKAKKYYDECMQDVGFETEKKEVEG
jgi:hypothetical protein